MKLILCSSLLSIILFSGCKVSDLDSFSGLSLNLGDVQKGLTFGESLYEASKEITPEQEYYIGRSVSASILAKYKIHKNEEVSNYVNSIGELLIAHSQMPELFNGYHFVILESDEINAFATPGGFIFITKSLLKLCTNEDELAAVLAHEIAHIQLQHGVKSIKDSRWTSLATMVGGEVASKHLHEDLANLTQSFNESINDVVTTLAVNGYSRTYENEADKYAQDVLNKTGYASSALSDMLNKMDKKLRNDERGFGSTHPKASERVEYIKELNIKDENSISKLRTKRFLRYTKSV